MRVTGSVQHSLEAECAQLRTHFEQCQREHDALLMACALMSGALYPLYARMTSLAAQRHLLSEQVTNQEAFQQQVLMLVEALSLDRKPQDGKPGQAQRKQRAPLLRFRAAAIAILAGNRLCHQAKNNCRMFTAVDALPQLYSMVVCAGGVQPQVQQFSGQCPAQQNLGLSASLHLLPCWAFALHLTQVLLTACWSVQHLARFPPPIPVQVSQ